MHNPPRAKPPRKRNRCLIRKFAFFGLKNWFSLIRPYLVWRQLYNKYIYIYIHICVVCTCIWNMSIYICMLYMCIYVYTSIHNCIDLCMATRPESKFPVPRAGGDASKLSTSNKQMTCYRWCPKTLAKLVSATPTTIGYKLWFTMVTTNINHS